MSEITVSVVYALPGAVTEIEVRLTAGATVADAIERSGIAARLPDVDIAAAPVGIFGKRVRRDTTLGDGNRVEIYRRLIADPKVVRRRRALSGRVD
ncbi:MAG TPA: RnfH family protein [Casimicrobiaceae bacterium]|nr:RnfH family protein [Casimicrobiaceae bacterium]